MIEYLILQLADTAEAALSFLWLPLVIWTVFALLGWFILRLLPSLHPQLQYQGRLAILLALPSGLLALGLMKWAEHTWFAGSPETNLTFITFAAPIEITPALQQQTEGAAVSDWLLAIGLALFAAGVLFFALRFCKQWLQLQVLRNSLVLSAADELEVLNLSNRKLAAGFKRPIHIAFLQDDIVPVTFGYRKPVILLPEKLKQDPEKLNLAVRHELTHIIQNDFITHSGVVLTQLAFWFHPLIYILKRELVDYRELRCDSIVLTSREVSPKQYASLLLELMPMPNVNKDLSVHMAQESSNLKKRIQMIANQTPTSAFPKRMSLAVFCTVIISTAIAMACTDMQTHDIYDNEELDIMTDIDRSGERGYHEIIIYMSEEQQAERHESKLAQLQVLQPEHISSIEVWRGDEAIERYGDRGSEGVIVVKTQLDAESYNNTLRAMGLNPVNPQDLAPSADATEEDFFVVVEEMPELIGGLQQLQQDIRYPEMARRAGIEGRVYVQFIVTEEGDVDNARIIRGIGGGADEEALRVVQNAKFRPGMQRGRAVRVQYSLPIFFRLASDEPTSSLDHEAPEGGMSVTGYSSDATVSNGRSVEPQLIRETGNRLPEDALNVIGYLPLD